MRENACELCGHEAENGSIEKHHIVPREVREQAGIRRARVIRLCSNCHEELRKWYSTRVADMTYDTKMKRFRARSPLEMVKEYEAAYRLFTRYKEQRR